MRPVFFTLIFRRPREEGRGVGTEGSVKKLLHFRGVSNCNTRRGENFEAKISLKLDSVLSASRRVYSSAVTAAAA